MPNDRIVDLIEQHVEKFVVIVCGLLLVFGVGRWVVTSPTRFKPTGETPEKVDEGLLSKAQSIRTHLDNQKAPEPSVSDYRGIIERLRKGPTVESMIDLTCGRPPLTSRTGIIKPPDMPNLAALVSLMPAPAKPVVRAGHRVPNTEKIREIPFADPISSYPIERLSADWRKRLEKFKEISPQPVALATEFHYQEASPGGLWSSPKSFACAGPGPLGADGKPIELPRLTKFNGENGQAVLDSAKSVANQAIQAHILRPGYWNIWDARGQGWVPWAPGRIALPGAESSSWSHHDGLALNKLYRYRARIALINPLYSHTKQVDPQRPDDARVSHIWTSWSPWSDPVGVPRITRFFLTGSNPSAGWVKVTVQTRHMGQQVEDNFKVSPGQLIGGVGKARIPLPGKKEPVEVKVDFSTGAVAVDVDFRKPYFKKGLPATTTQMVYMAGDGKLHVRLLSADREAYQATQQPKKPVVAPPSGPGTGDRPPAPAQPRVRPTTPGPDWPRTPPRTTPRTPRRRAVPEPVPPSD